MLDNIGVSEDPVDSIVRVKPYYLPGFDVV